MDCLNGFKILLVRHKKDFTAVPLKEHRSAFHDFTLVLKGELFYKINKEPILARAGEAIYCPPGASLWREKADGVSYISINICTKGDETLPLPFYLKDIMNEEITPYVDLLKKELKQKSRHSEEFIYNVVKMLLMKVISKEESKNKDPYAIKVKDYIINHFKEDISLESVSKSVSLHPSYLSTVFKRREGKSITEYITDVRIANAKEMLTNTQMSVGEIGLSCGFADQYYFSRVFSHSTGYRRLIQTYGVNSDYDYYENKKEKGKYKYDF